MAFDWKRTISAVAPAIGTALGGPVGGLAVQALCSVFGLGPDTDEEQLARAVAGMTPEQAVELRKADQQFQVQMRELDIDLERIHQQDRDSARKRNIATNDKTTPALAIIVTAGFFAVVGWVLINGIPVGGETAALLIGGVVSVATQVFTYYFGSSAGSARKTEAMAERMTGGGR